MMPVQMMVGEVHIEKFNCMKCSKKSIIVARLMHELMRDHELSSIVIGSDEGESEDVR